MKLSFVIPAYNEEAYLTPCLEAILREKQKVNCDIEIIVVNNASTDRTKDIALSFPGVVVVDEPRKGLTFARQAGFKASSGDLIANVDADSVLTPGWIEIVMGQFQNPKLIALSGPFIYYDLPIFSNFLIRIYYYIAFVSYLLNRFVFRVGSLLQGGNFVVRRSSLEKIGGYNTSFVFYGEDTEIARRLNSVGSVAFTFKLPMYTSGRRLKSEGVLTMGFKYPVNYFWTIFFKKPFSESYTDIRQAGSQTTAYTTSQQTLHRALSMSVAGLLIVLTAFLGGTAYVYEQVTKLTQPSTAQARQDSSLLVREFGPVVLRTQKCIHAWEADSDDK